jgi:hypothetical protein
MRSARIRTPGGLYYHLLMFPEPGISRARSVGGAGAETGPTVILLSKRR